MELLAPCGNYEALIGVINAGADAVYLAGSKYGARAYADNFTDDEIIKAIKYAHLFNVKIYLTVNTLIKENEYTDVLNYIKLFYDNGLDACIVQDIGLISVFSKFFPNMECHVSTQAFSTGSNSVQFFKDLGASRVVLARELSLEEIKTIKKECDIEIETFIHGAMCYSYSGQCLFSSCLGGRSGNRGRCAGPCRLNYECNGKSGYLLSMKDQCTLEILPSLIKAGIDSLKIEGRMKKPEYAAFVTAMYRKYIDLYHTNPDKYKVSNDDINKLNSFYMRSEISNGYYNTRNGASMLCLNNPAYAKTEDYLLEKTKDIYLKKAKKLPVDIYINCQVNQPLNITFTCCDTCVSLDGNIVEASIKRPSTEEDIKKQLTKLGDTFFYALKIFVNMSKECFVPVKELNELRRQLSLLLEKEILSNYTKINESKYTFKSRNNVSCNDFPIVMVSTREQLDAVVKTCKDKIYLTIDYELYVKEKEYISVLDDSVFLKAVSLPYIMRINEYNIMETVNKDPVIKAVICHNLDELYYFKTSSKIVISGPGLYVWNKMSVDIINKCSDIFINSYELSYREIKDLGDNKGYNLIYGRIPLMQTANCIEKTTRSCHKNSGSEFIYLKDRKGISFPVKRNCTSCYNTIYNSVPTSLHDTDIDCKINGKILINFSNETYDEVSSIINCFILKKDKFSPTEFTRGYYKRGVE